MDIRPEIEQTEFMCTKCTKYLSAPMMSDCGHFYCNTCWWSAIGQRYHNPQCSSTIVVMKSPPEAFLSLLKIKYKCPHQYCPYLGQKSDVIGHMTSCEYNPLIRCKTCGLKLKLPNGSTLQHSIVECNTELLGRIAFLERCLAEVTRKLNELEARQPPLPHRGRF